MSLMCSKSLIKTPEGNTKSVCFVFLCIRNQHEILHSIIRLHSLEILRKREQNTLYFSLVSLWTPLKRFSLLAQCYTALRQFYTALRQFYKVLSVFFMNNFKEIQFTHLFL